MLDVVAVCKECELGRRICVLKAECSSLLINGLLCLFPTSLCHLRTERPVVSAKRNSEWNFTFFPLKPYAYKSTSQR